MSSGTNENEENYLKLQGDENQQYGSSQGGYDNQGGSSDYNQPPASNPGYGDPSGGISENSGGRDDYSSGNRGGDSYGAGNTGGDSYDSGNRGDNYGSSNTSGDSYGSGNTGGDSYSSGNTGGDNYGSSNTGGDSYSSGNTGGDSYGSGNPDERRGHDDEDNKLSDAPGEGSSAAKKDNWPKENRDAIPTAGGEKLGQKHWGESQMVPDLPKTQESEYGNVSSSEGQPDSQTRDNTYQNTGGAQPSSYGDDNNNNNNQGGDNYDGEGKQKFTDKIKDKLHMGKSSDN